MSLAPTLCSLHIFLYALLGRLLVQKLQMLVNSEYFLYSPAHLEYSVKRLIMFICFCFDY